ncbi:MAG: high-potential iron-sulfur protein [Congregibacter sp.]
MDKKISRRSVLLRGLQIPIAGSALLGLAACEGDSGDLIACADPGTMTSAEESVRRALNYTESSTDAGKLCAGCEFFYPPKDGSGCGSCEIFGGKPVNPGGRCDSWSVDS